MEYAACSQTWLGPFHMEYANALKSDLDSLLRNTLHVLKPDWPFSFGVSCMLSNLILSFRVRCMFSDWILSFGVHCMFSNLIWILSCGVHCRFSDLDSLLWSILKLDLKFLLRSTLQVLSLDSLLRSTVYFQTGPGISPAEYVRCRPSAADACQQINCNTSCHTTSARAPRNCRGEGAAAKRVVTLHLTPPPHPTPL